MRKASRSIVQVPCCFVRSFIKFEGHTRRKIDDVNPIWVRLLSLSQLSHLQICLVFKYNWLALNKRMWDCCITSNLNIISSAFKMNTLYNVDIFVFIKHFIRVFYHIVQDYTISKICFTLGPIAKCKTVVKTVRYMMQLIKYIQCGAVITRSVSHQCSLNQGELWGVCCECELWFMF